MYRHWHTKLTERQGGVVLAFLINLNSVKYIDWGRRKICKCLIEKNYQLYWIKAWLIDLITLVFQKFGGHGKLMYRLNKAGYRVRHDAPRPDGDIVVINTWFYW